MGFTLATQFKSGLRWWPASVILALSAAIIIWIRQHQEWSFQERNLSTLSVALSALALLLLWWLAFSRAPGRIRLYTAGVVIATLAGAAGLFRFHGVSGDLVPILDFRWSRASSSNQSAGESLVRSALEGGDFPQFLGPHRNAQLESPRLAQDWAEHSPKILWRRHIGSAWSGWAIVGNRAFTQEQLGDTECVTCYETLTGRLVWSHADGVHYQSGLAGQGPRCTPTVSSNRVFTLGATGILNCLDIRDGRVVWSRDIVRDAQSRIPEWGFAGSPLVYDGKVVVSAGGRAGHSLLAYRSETGELAWAAGDQSASYASPCLATLANVRQVLAFNSHRITAHDANSGKVLWEYPWGDGHPQASAPVIVGPNRVLFSSGYGVGCELLEISAGTSPPELSATRLWRSRQMKAKFANLVQQDGFLYGLDDGVFSCLDLKDGTRLWKEGRYGHGQGLLVNNLFLLMAENGELVLLRPASTGPNEIHRFRLFNQKTWNPIALSGDLLLARNDQEAACVRLPVEQLSPTQADNKHAERAGP